MTEPFVCSYCGRGMEEVSPVERFVRLDADGTYKPFCMACGFKDIHGERLGVKKVRLRSLE